MKPPAPGSLVPTDDFPVGKYQRALVGTFYLTGLGQESPFGQFSGLLAHMKRHSHALGQRQTLTISLVDYHGLESNLAVRPWTSCI